MRAKDIFTHPWVKGFEEQQRMKKVSRSPDRNKSEVIQRSPDRGLKSIKDQRSPERVVKTMKDQRSPDRVVKNVQRSPERGVQKTTQSKTGQKSPSRIHEINLPLKRDVKKDKSPLKSSNNLLDFQKNPALLKKSDKQILQREIQMDNDIKRENSAGPAEVLRMRKKFEHQYTFAEAKPNLDRSMDQQDDMFHSVMDKVYVKNKGKKGTNNKHLDVDSLIQQDLNNSNILASSIEFEGSQSHRDLLSNKHQLERQLEEESGKIRKNKNKLAILKNDNEHLETYRGSGHRGLESDEDYPEHQVHKMNRDYYPKGKNLDLDRSYQKPEKLSTMPHSILTTDSLNDDIYMNQNRNTNRGSKYNRKSNLGIKNFVSEITRE
jgi:hypothetical protein